jgi:hypothetical protein
LVVLPPHAAATTAKLTPRTARILNCCMDASQKSRKEPWDLSRGAPYGLVSRPSLRSVRTSGKSWRKSTTSWPTR